MAIELAAGQTLAADFTLLHQIDTTGADNLWLAMQESTQERVQVEVLASPVDSARAQSALDQYQALIHPNILRGYRVFQHEGASVLVTGYRRNLVPLDLQQPLNLLWPQLKVIIEALQYAHSLGFVHGKLTPGQCMISDDGNIYLKGFGAPTASNGQYVPNDATPDARTDIYSIAQIIYTCLTGAPVTSPDQSLSTPIDPDLDSLLRSMIHPEPQARPGDFMSLIKLLDTQAEQSVVQSVEFSRADNTASMQRSATDEQAQQSNEHRLPRERRVVSMPVTLSALALLIVFASLLFVFLPQTAFEADQPSPAPASTDTKAAANANTAPEAEVATPAPLELAKLEELKEQGVALAAELLRRQVEVEDIGGTLWAGDRYEASTALGIAGDEAYRDQQFQTAVDQYRAGIALLDEVLDEAETVFEENLAAGQQALLEGDFATAVSAYKILTRIKPEDTELAAAQQRADNLEQVVRHSRDGEVLERNGDLAAALDEYRAANQLDSKWQPAAEGIKRINRQLARNRFQDKMSEGFAAIASADFAAAEAAFNAAQTILPNSTEPLDGLQQIELAKVQAEVNRINQDINALEAVGNWQDAIPLYEEILGISPGLNPAIEGLAQARDKAELQTTLTRYIEQPQLMKSDDELDQAKAALVAATRSGEHFREQARTLSHLVALARLEVQVQLTSDGKTAVTVYQVAHYGEIEEAQLALVPGIYTFVGKRPGYRDVYQEIHIKGDINPVVVNVVCNERI
jgi:tetratricopeptide (TPR) repeat protein